MADIKSFPKKTEAKTEPKPARIWVCNCGCCTFELLETGETRCAVCSATEAHGGGWHTNPHEQEWAGDSPMKDIRGQDEVSFVKSLMKSRIEDDSAALVVMLEKSGRLHTWSVAETKEQSDWQIGRASCRERV